ncbi:Phage terminase-like protein, large subunit, contains N-terminal HTH domain [Shimia gijangensis]|uniref:Phage terminase-like protein, large subunit, contains N-terminal HTH domain n=1 Tax=Shimia gijangensis TaxID=1470563 RepID=A0A1M6RU64_9RHOB|nr:terminase TerL endonuclease subunit [Shimia gijangensis]SHK36061.1 Phage terminase-like protein, large subunit, contains N-terminal HTH domain [Shimia gijangensis]
MKSSTIAIRFLETLAIPEGPKAGEPIKLAPFQKQFVKGALDDGIQVAVLSIGRGNAKTALSAGIALGAVMGKWDSQPRREILIAARTRDQARIAFDFVVGFIRGLPESEQEQFTIRRSPRLEIEYGDGHVIRAIAADGKSALGSAPNLVLMDERGHWAADQGDTLEHALLSGIGKRGGRALIISTSAPDDAHPFSVWLDETQEGVYVQEHRPSPGLPADDLASLKEANPGAAHGIGSSLEWLRGQARRAIARGGSTLTSFRLYNRNERVSGETRDVLLTVDEWMNCEVSEAPERRGQVVIGIDLGGSASMTAAAFYWPETGRLECLGTFPSRPTLLDRGQNDGVNDRYVQMQDRGELSVLGDQTVPVAPWLVQVMQHVEGEAVAAITADRYKQAELGEAIDKAGIRAPVIWRGQGFRDGGEDCERLRRAAFDGKVQTPPSLLLRSAFADAVTLRDPANNLKLAKARSTGRIDAAAATVLAVAEGARIMGRPEATGGRLLWV